MGLMGLIRRIGHNLNLTSTIRRETSDEVFYADSVISKRDNLRGRNLTEFQRLLGNFQYIVEFSVRGFNFEFYDKEMYDRFNQGERVRVGYKEVCDVSYALVPPNFEWQVNTKTFVMPYFVGVEKAEPQRAEAA